MDKRWILLIIIAIVGISCMYNIVTTSTSIGTPITNLNKSLVTIPDDYGIGDTDKKSVEIYNKSCEEEKLYIEDLGKVNESLDKFNSKLNKLSHDSNVKIIKNSSNYTDGIDVHSVYYQKLDNPDKYESVSYITCINHTFYIKMYGYDDLNQMDYPFNFVVDTLQPDYKRSQD
ncbi:hypothetical protein [Methanobrevibacter sp.]|uniref:hypothetical protein n=1 Tax=Methanobrevibacter sp. TaxID=66852 RepID=UPI00388F23E0